MELSILDANGLPDGSILSVRSGPTRRQSPLPCAAPFRLPAGPWPLRIDVLALLGKSQTGASLGKLDASGCCKVPLEARDGRHMSVTLQVFEGKAGSTRPKTTPNITSGHKELEEPEAEATPPSPVRRRDTEAEARAYLDRHRLHEFMHALFELLLRERPEDPYSFIAARFREAADLEKNQLPDIGTIGEIQKLPNPAGLGSTSSDVLRSSVSTAPTIRKEPSSPLPDGALQITVQSLRGRTLAKMTAQPSDRVSDVKARIQANLGVPINGQSLFWWAETLSNDTTLEDHDIPPHAHMHLVCNTRDPRLQLAISGSSDGGLKLWNLQNGELVRDFSGGDTAKAQKVQAVEVDWASMRALSGSFSGCLHIWDIAAGLELARMDGHRDEVNVLQVDWPGNRALSGSSDRSAKLWDLKERTCVHTLAADSPVYNLAADWSRNRAFGGLRSGNLRIWDLLYGACLRDVNIGALAAEAASTVVSSVAIDPVGYRAVSGLEDGHLSYWHFAEDEDPEKPAAPLPATKVLLAHYSAIRTIVATWAETNSRALIGSDDGSLSLWRLDTQECLARFARHIGMVWAIQADWVRERCVSGAFDGCVKLWDLHTGECIRTLQGHTRPVRSIAAG